MRAHRVGELVPRSSEGVRTGEGGRGADARIGDAIRLVGSCIGLISVARPVPASKLINGIKHMPVRFTESH